MSHPTLAAAAWLQTTAMKTAEVSSMAPAATGPDVKPRFDFPYADTLYKWLGWGLAIFIIICAVFFFRGAGGVLANMRGKKEGGIGGDVALMVVAALFAIGAAGGTAWFYSIANQVS